MSKFSLIIISLSLLLFAGCSTSSIAIIDEPLTVNNTGQTYEGEAVIGIDFAHWKAHKGEHYYKRDYLTMPGSSTLDIIIYTSNAKAHFLPQFIGNSGAISVELYSDTIISNNGTAVNYSNSNFNYNDTNGLRIFRSPTVVSVGNSRGKSYSGQSQKISGEIRGNSEIILKPNSVYMFRVHNEAATSNILTCNFDWYDD